MTDGFKPTFLDRAICNIAPAAGARRLAARRVLHEFRYDGAGASTKRAQAPQNTSPNSFDVQRDRLQLMREAEDMERNFAPAKMLNRKVAMYCAPISYHAQTGDHTLNRDVEEYLDEVFKNCDVTQRYGFYKMMEFGIMGCNRGGDYGWAFMRPGLEEGMSEEDAVQLDLKIQAVESDRIGGIYQNVVSNDYVAGLLIGHYGEVTAYRVFHRSMTTNVYDNPVDVPASQFVHMTDPMRIDQYRGVSILATAIQNLRDLYEMVDFQKGKSKLASALTVFTNSNGAMSGSGQMDAYSTNLPTGSGASALQQDINFGQINHLPGGTDIKFPASVSPSTEEQWVMTLMLKFVAMSYNLPYSFALDAAALGGVSSRLESEMAKAEFERVQKVIAPHASRIKDAFLYDAIAKGIFPARVYRDITKGRWGFRAHPQPDLGKEASAAVNLNQNGLLNPIKYWTDDAQDPREVAEAMGQWAAIKRDTAEKYGFEVVDVFGNGPSKPVSVSESTTESTTNDSTGKQFSRKEFRESDSSIAKRIEETEQTIADLEARKAKFQADLAANESDGSPSLVQRARIAIDAVNRDLTDERNDLAELKDREWRRANNKPVKAEPTPDEQKARAQKAKKRDDRHALVEALKRQGFPDNQAYAISYDIVESGDFQQSKLPADIQKKYFP